MSVLIADAHGERPAHGATVAKPEKPESKRRIAITKFLQRLNLLAICLLGGVLAAVLIAQVRPGGRPPDRDRALNEASWPKTLEVYPLHPGDPVKLVKIMKGGNELVPGTYRMPQISGDPLQNVDAVKEWLRDASFTLRSQTSKNIVSVGIAVVFPVRRTDVDCHSVTGVKPAREPWCDAYPHWCDGGCPTLIHNTLHWGKIPHLTASGLEARYRAEAKRVSFDLPDGTPLQGKESLRIAPGEEITLSPAGRFDGIMTGSDPRHGLSNTMNVIVRQEGLEEARGAEPCVDRANSKTGCAFAEVSRFNIGIDVVYFEDGTIWGNYGYGYALPNPDGIFTRVDARDFPGLVGSASAPN